MLTRLNGFSWGDSVMRHIITPAGLPQFRNSLGVAPHQYLLKRRLDRARNLLQTNRQSIAEIASVTGFSDQSHLTRHFKRRFGITPQECRRDDSRFVPGASQYALTNTQAVP